MKSTQPVVSVPGCAGRRAGQSLAGLLRHSSWLTLVSLVLTLSTGAGVAQNAGKQAVAEDQEAGFRVDLQANNGKKIGQAGKSALARPHP